MYYYCDTIYTMYDDITYQILSYVATENDYSSLVKRPSYKASLQQTYRHHNARHCSTLIEHHFSRLFYLHLTCGIPCKESVHLIFDALDYNGVFSPPCYYDIRTYIQAFREFDSHAVPCYFLDTSYDIYNDAQQEKIYKKTTSKLAVQKKRQSRNVFAITLC